MSTDVIVSIRKGKIRKRLEISETGWNYQNEANIQLLAFTEVTCVFGALHRFMDTTIDTIKDYGHQTRYHTGVLLTHQKYFSY